MAKIDSASFNEVKNAANLKEKSSGVNEVLHRLTIDIPKDMVKGLKILSVNKSLTMRNIVMSAIQDYLTKHNN